jgi:NAD(P)-dependent dehydrogenase (short-subunit alcohol dehydrogenase family)
MASPFSDAQRRLLPARPQRNVHGKVVLVTGASQGIGAAVAAELADRGAHVALLARNAAALAELVDRLPGEHAWYCADVTSDESMEKAVAGVIERFGRIDVVLANAGITSYGSVFVAGSDDLARVLDTNVTGVYRTIRAALPHLRESRGYVMVMSSISTVIAPGGMSAYASSKVAVEHLAHVLHLEVARAGIGVGTLYASWIDTPMISDAEHAMPSFAKLRRMWAWPADLPGMGWWPGGTTSAQSCASSIVDGIERRSRRVWVPKTVWALSMGRMLVNSRPGERLQIHLLGNSAQQIDAEVRAKRQG